MGKIQTTVSTKYDIDDVIIFRNYGHKAMLVGIITDAWYDWGSNEVRYDALIASDNVKLEDCDEYDPIWESDIVCKITENKSLIEKILKIK